MRKTNSLKFMYLKFSNFSDMLFSRRYLLAIVAALILLISSCKKTVEPITENILQQYFEQNILNKDYIVKLATDTGVILTSNYEGYRFRLLQNTLLDGPMTATKNGMVLNGSWSCNEDYSKLTINFSIPAAPPEFSFIVRSWKFTRKAIPVMELAPWGTTDPKILHMERQ